MPRSLTFTQAFARTLRSTSTWLLLLLPLVVLLLTASVLIRPAATQFAASGYPIAIINDSDTVFASSLVAQLRDDPTFAVDAASAQPIDALREGSLVAVVKLPAGFGQLNDQDVPVGKAEIAVSSAGGAAARDVTEHLRMTFSDLSVQATSGAQAQQPLLLEQRVIEGSDPLVRMILLALSIAAAGLIAAVAFIVTRRGLVSGASGVVWAGVSVLLHVLGAIPLLLGTLLLVAIY